MSKTLWPIPVAPPGRHSYDRPAYSLVTALTELTLMKNPENRKRLALKLADVLHSVTIARYECTAITAENEAIDVKQVIAVSKFAPLEEQCLCHCGAIFKAVRVENFVMTELT